MKAYSNELRLLFEVSQSSPSIEIITELFNDELSQEHLFSLSVANGVLPLLYEVLKEYPQFSLIQDFQEESLQIKNINFFMSAQLLQLIYLLNTKGIQVIPIKGPLLAEHAYNSISLRPFSDLDILAQKEDLLEIAQVLLSLGYQCEKSLETLRHPYILKKFSDISFIHPQTNLIIELHWKLLKTATAELSHINNLFKRSIQIPFQQTELQSLPLEEEFLYLSVHASKHRFERIEWMNDLNKLYEKHHTVYDWNKLLNIAKSEGYLSPYLLALRILNKNYHHDITNTHCAQLIKGSKPRTLYNKAFSLHADDYILHSKKDGIRWTEILFSISLEDSLRKKVYLFINIIFPLYTDDILATPNLPKALRFLYYLKRLQRTIKGLFLNK